MYTIERGICMILKVQMKQAGRRGAKITTASLPLGKTPDTIEELIILTVKTTHGDFKRRVENSDKLEEGELEGFDILSPIMIEDKAASGKIGFGRIENKKVVSEKKAVETALQAFEDGIVAIFIDENRYENLQDKLSLTGDETVTFVKLAMLAGRMW